MRTDGRLKGTESIQTVPCDQTALTCAVTVPAPGVALVFLTQTADPTNVPTFSTSAVTRTLNTATVPASVLATSNGENGSGREHLAGTSRGSSGAGGRNVPAAVGVLAGAVLGAWVVWGAR